MSKGHEKCKKPLKHTPTIIKIPNIGCHSYMRACVANYLPEKAYCQLKKKPIIPLKKCG